MVSPLGGPAGAQPAASRRAAGLKAACAAAALAAASVAAERGTVILLRKQRVGEWPHLGGSGDGLVSSSLGVLEREKGLEPSTLCLGSLGSLRVTGGGG